MSHALGQYLQDQMAERGWTASELARRSGITKQSIAHLTADDRDHLGRMLQQSTFTGLATALGVPVEVLVMKCAESMGIPVPPPLATDPAALADGPTATLEQVFEFLGGEGVPDAVLLDYLERCLDVAAKIAHTLAVRRHAAG